MRFCLQEEEGDVSSAKAASKYLYHAMHKLCQLRALSIGNLPEIFLAERTESGGDVKGNDGEQEQGRGALLSEDRERIMRVRLCVRDAPAAVTPDDETDPTRALAHDTAAATAAAAAAAAAAARMARALQLIRTELAAAEAELAQLRAPDSGALWKLEQTLPDEVDSDALTAWLLSVRRRMWAGAQEEEEGGYTYNVDVAPSLLSRQISVRAKNAPTTLVCR